VRALWSVYVLSLRVDVLLTSELTLWPVASSRSATITLSTAARESAGPIAKTARLTFCAFSSLASWLEAPILTRPTLRTLASRPPVTVGLLFAEGESRSAALATVLSIATERACAMRVK
jgi:hypothetical protein